MRNCKSRRKLGAMEKTEINKSKQKPKHEKLSVEWNSLGKGIHEALFRFDCNEAESWLSERELYMMQDERGKDEFSTQNQVNIYKNAIHNNFVF